nr:PREDICTED: uncharacterized protein LOC105675935 [Linepithema humile]
MLAKVPPDGGWGWIIVLSGALNGLSTIPIIQSFGLIFNKDYLAELNITEANRTVLININLAFGMILGLINGPLLKSFGYRKVATVGTLIFSLGIILTAFAKSFTHFVISYGLLTSVGLSMAMAGFSLAINSYFSIRRERAVGLSITVTGLGPIFVPQLITILLKVYDIQGTVLLLGAYSLHSVIAVMLLQPIKWHMKSAPLCLETISENPNIAINSEGDYNSEDDTDIHNSKLVVNNYQRKRKLTLSSIDYNVDAGSICGFDTLPRQMSIDKTISYQSTYTEMSAKNTSMTNLHNNRKYSKYSWRNAAKSTESVNLGSSMKIFDESVPIARKLDLIENGVSKSNDVNQSIIEVNSALKEVEKETDDSSVGENSDKNDEKNKSIIRQILRRVIDLFDFEILRDPIYLNIMLGMSIAIFAEVNFSMLTPSFLDEMKMEKREIANTMSIIAMVDLISRGAAPYLAEWLRQPPRVMYMLSLVLLLISRLMLLFVNSFVTLMAVAIGLGLAKGIRSVYMLLIVPTYVPLQKLPNASSIQMVSNGIFLMCGGPILGAIREKCGNYTVVIILINIMTAITVIIWTVEMIVTKRSARQRLNSPEKS